MGPVMDKITLHGFNNLTKTLSFNIYDICYAKSAAHQKEYIKYIDEVYNADRLTEILKEVANIIGADILNISSQDYDPQGASVTMLVAEHPIDEKSQDLAKKAEPGPLPEDLAAHLNKSHITVHTYPESHPDDGISTFRVDIDVSTCGVISPLKALNYLIHSFDSDIVLLDYRVRGFTRDIEGKKYYIDHDINSIQDFMPDSTKDLYEMIDVNVYQENIFHTKMLLKHFNLDSYLFGLGVEALSRDERKDIEQKIRREMLEIFYSKNFTS